MNNTIIILGAPCSGKGTISKILSEKINFIHLSIGEALRKKYEIGHAYRTHIDAGNMISNDIVQDILLDYENKNIVLDGFPRTINQIDLLKNVKYNIKAVIVLNVNKNILIQRMNQRLQCNLCGLTMHTNTCNGQITKRIDDTIEIYERRYNTYIKEIDNIVACMKNLYKIITINNNENEKIENIVQKIIETMN